MAPKRRRWLKVSLWIVGLVLIVPFCFIATKHEWFQRLFIAKGRINYAHHLQVQIRPETPNETDCFLHGKPKWYRETVKWFNGIEVFGIYIGRTHGFYDIKFDPGTPSLDLSNIKHGDVIYSASKHYALKTGDFQVSLQEVIDAGFIPYHEIVEGLDTNSYICECHGSRRMINPSELEDQDHPEQQVRAKNEILEWFFGSYARDYLKNNDNNTPCNLMELTTYPQFWINPFTGVPMSETRSDGNYVLVEEPTYRGRHCYSGKLLPAGSIAPYIVPSKMMLSHFELNKVNIYTPTIEEQYRENTENP